MPFSKRIVNNIPEHIDVMLRARGFELFWFALHHDKRILVIDLKTKSTNTDKVGIGLNAEVQSQFRNLMTTMQVVSVMPDTLQIYLSAKYQKKIPVMADLDLSIKKKFGLYKPITIRPDSIFIAGDKAAIDRITEIHTQTVSIQEADHEMKIKIPLLDPQNGVILSSGSVTIEFPIEEFIENKIKVPVYFKHAGVRKTFLVPDNVEITYTSALRYFDRLPTDSFHVEVYKNEHLPEGKLSVRLVTQPQKAKVVAVLPSMLNYYIEK